MIPKLKPCPFCGLPPTVIEKYPGSNLVGIRCFNQSCAQPRTMFGTRELIAAAWNMRHELKQPEKGTP